MSKLFFNIIRPGINTTIQDLGRNNYHHIGLPSSGAMDKRNFVIANKLVGNNLIELLPTSIIATFSLFRIVLDCIISFAVAMRMLADENEVCFMMRSK